MKAQDYIQTKLDELLSPADVVKPADDEQLVGEITRLTLSKKFRKYSVAPEPLEHIKTSIKVNVENREPIKFTLPFGAYKLWRLDETPEADWAELFAMTYFTKWLKPICAIYEPGVWFDFFSDDVVVPRMNNIPPEDLLAYNRSFHAVLDFMKAFQPKNLNMTLTRALDQYASQADFDQDLDEQIAKLAAELPGGLPELTAADKAVTELNVKTTPEQAKDSQWRQKVHLIHEAYGSVRGRRPYYRDPAKHKIMVVTTPLLGMLTVGSTKDSTVKFWVGAGALKPRDDSFRQIILSPSQLGKTKFHFETMALDSLLGKNFKRVRVIE